ncbi:TIGR01777 family oxidoreductase [Aeromicrobium sp. CTD01-1L150]|uniref:TIGR01777 family oxidoreductase n=1 Tax=Aeromicrobium sp. CTD01-1L150 TaxID=3341830 RepID=UPI0035BF7D8B
MHVVVAGASGFLGTALVAHLREVGHQVTRLIRSGEPAPDSSQWDPASGRIDRVLIDRADAVVNLSGATIARWPRTRRYERVLWDSRIDSTKTLVSAISAAETATTLVSASALGYYGNERGQEPLTEGAPAGSGFLAELCQAWESAAEPAAESGGRVATLRTGLPLHADGGMLKPLLPLFKVGAGARLGSGDQLMSVLALHDWARAVTFLLESSDASGPFNLALPRPVTNAEFTDGLGKALSRPTFFVAPSLVLRTALGALADDLLGSVGMVPSALLEAGFTFEHPDLASTLQAALT